MRAVLTAIACVTVLAVAGGCGKKSSDAAAPSSELTGLAVVPSDAEVVIGIDVARVASSQLVQRAVDQLLLRDADVSARWQKLHDSCKLDVASQVKRVMLAIGPHQGDKPGTGPTVMIVTGKLVEDELAACVRAMVGQGGGSLTARAVEGHTLYQAKDGARTMFFAFGRPDTVVLGANEAYVTAALSAGKKVQDDPDMSRYLQLADQNAPIWAAGRVDPRVRGGLQQVTEGKLSAGPVAFVAAVDPSEGAKVTLGAVMANAADAKTLESFAKKELPSLAMFAQIKGLQKIVDHIDVSSTPDSVVHFALKLTIDDVNQLLTALDGGPAPAQGSAPSGP